MVEENKTVVRNFVAALGKGDVEGMRACIAENIAAVCTGTCLLSGTRGYAEVLGAAGMLGQITKAGIDFKVLTLTAEDDRVAAELEGTSMLVNDKPYNNQYHFLFTLSGGKIVGMKEYMDTLLTENLLGPFVRGSA